eukprot:snap_masked-scaffold_42-processed-gene-0.9-mRNA-1 protein AED:0.04 eAED:0.07 QI:0/-1/0/1/-1/1/1/0/323
MNRFLAIIAIRIVLSVSTPIPVIISHGMGDSCFNPGIKSLSKAVSSWLSNAEVLCVPLGDSLTDDALHSFSLTMTEQVEVYANRLKKLSLENSFSSYNGLGFSQGNLLLRAYAQKYNENPSYPTLKNFISIHGPMLGVAALPRCDPENAMFPLNYFCKLLLTVSTSLAYSNYIQNHLAQSNYLRSVFYYDSYIRTEFLPLLNGETQQDCGSLASLESLVLVKAANDQMVNPKESEWFGYYKLLATELTDEFIEKYNETTFYKRDTFGLRTLDEQKKLFFIETPGDHLQVSNDAMRSLIKTHFASSKRMISIKRNSDFFEVVDE